MRSLRIETPRLIIAEFEPWMARIVHENSLDADNRRFLPDEVFETEDAAAEAIACLLRCREAGHGPQVHPVLLKNGICIGHVQAVPMEEGGWEIGFHIAGVHAGMGYATEAVRAFLPEAMRRLGIARMNAVCAVENGASARVLEKCGFALESEGAGRWQGEVRAVRRYAVDAANLP